MVNSKTPNHHHLDISARDHQQLQLDQSYIPTPDDEAVLNRSVSVERLPTTNNAEAVHDEGSYMKDISSSSSEEGQEEEEEPMVANNNTNNHSYPSGNNSDFNLPISHRLLHRKGPVPFHDSSSRGTGRSMNNINTITVTPPTTLSVTRSKSLDFLSNSGTVRSHDDYFNKTEFSVSDEQQLAGISTSLSTKEESPAQQTRVNKVKSNDVLIVGDAKMGFKVVQAPAVPKPSSSISNKTKIPKQMTSTPNAALQQDSKGKRAEDSSGGGEKRVNFIEPPDDDLVGMTTPLKRNQASGPRSPNTLIKKWVASNQEMYAEQCGAYSPALVGKHQEMQDMIPSSTMITDHHQAVVGQPTRKFPARMKSFSKHDKLPPAIPLNEMSQPPTRKPRNNRIRNSFREVFGFPLVRPSIRNKQEHPLDTTNYFISVDQHRQQRRDSIAAGSDCSSAHFIKSRRDEPPPPPLVSTFKQKDRFNFAKHPQHHETSPPDSVQITSYKVKATR